MKFLKLIANLFPTDLPIGMTEFETWANDIITTYDLNRNKQLDRSYRFVLASHITTLGPNVSKVSKSYFHQVLKRASAGEIAGETMYRVREEQKAEMREIKEAEAAKKQLEATTTVLEASPSGQQQTI